MERDTQQLVEELARNACVSLFDAYGLTIRPAQVPMEDLESSLTGIVGFTGAGLTGMCMMVATEAPLNASNPTSGSLRDWVAELSNQLAGRIKHKLLAEGIEVYITTPIVLRAARIEPLPRKALLPLGFRADEGAIVLWIEVDTSAEFRAAPTGERPLDEGEALLF